MKTQKLRMFFQLLICFVITPTLFAQSIKNYNVENGAIVGQNTGRYNNRPLYINNTNAFVLTGDQPIARLVKDQFLYGTFMLAIERGGKAKWLQQCDQITAGYRAGRRCVEQLYRRLRCRRACQPQPVECRQRHRDSRLHHPDRRLHFGAAGRNL